MLYAMLAACATLIFVLVLARSSRGRVPSPGTPLSAQQKWAKMMDRHE